MEAEEADWDQAATNAILVPARGRLISTDLAGNHAHGMATSAQAANDSRDALLVATEAVGGIQVIDDENTHGGCPPPYFSHLRANCDSRHLLNAS